MQVTFLEASSSTTLSKTISGLTTKPYPFVKNVTSHKYDNVDIARLYTLIDHHANLGHCLLKGNPAIDLVDRSRAGSVRRQDLNQLLVLDFDGINHPAHICQKAYTQADVIRLAEVIINQLPPALKEVTYIAQASSSLGFKGDKLSLHIIFKLNYALPPATQKLWLQNTNFETPLLSDQIGLSVNGQSLTWQYKNGIGPIEIFCCILTLLSLCPVGCLSLEKLN